MTLYCDFCGRRWFAHWPEFWPYRYKNEIYCSENCRICSATLIKLGKGEKKLMARMKKDGTPAKKPGPKAKKPTVTLIEESGAPGFDEEEVQAIRDAVPTVKLDGPIRIETPETNKVEVVETPENVEKVIETPQLKLKPGLRCLNHSDFEVSAIRHPHLGEFYYDQKFGMVDWRRPEGEEISMSPKNWKELYLLIPDVMGILRVPDDE